MWGDVLNHRVVNGLTAVGKVLYSTTEARLRGLRTVLGRLLKLGLVGDHLEGVLLPHRKGFVLQCVVADTLCLVMDLFPWFVLLLLQVIVLLISFRPNFWFLLKKIFVIHFDFFLTLVDIESFFGIEVSYRLLLGSQITWGSLLWVLTWSILHKCETFRWWASSWCARYRCLLYYNSSIFCGK